MDEGLRDAHTARASEEGGCAKLLPSGFAVRGSENPAAVVRVAAVIQLTRTGVNDVRVLWIDGDAAHRQRALRVCQRHPRGSAIHRLPNAALRAGDVND